MRCVRVKCVGVRCVGVRCVGVRCVGVRRVGLSVHIGTCSKHFIVVRCIQM